MPKTIGSLDLAEKFPASSLLKLAKHQFGYAPFTCQMIYDAQLDYYGSEQRNKSLTATAIAQLMNRGFLIKHPEKSGGLTAYRVSKNDPMKKGIKTNITYRYIHELLEKHFSGKSFTAKNVSQLIPGRPDVRYQLSTLMNHKLIKYVRRDYRGKHYRLNGKEEIAESIKAEAAPVQSPEAQEVDIKSNVTSINRSTALDEPPAQDVPIKIVPKQIISEQVLETLDIPLELIGKAIVMKIADLRRTIDNLETTELTLKRQLDEAHKNAHTQSRIIESLNAKVTHLSKEAPRHSKKTIANLGEIARISTLKRK